MSLNATNFIVQGPIRSADMKQFVDLFTGVMTDQPVTFKNTLMVGGNQSSSTPPLKLFGVTGQTGNLIELYPTAGSANATFGFGALGNFAWGPGGAAANDTFLSRIALQNGHVTDTAGLLIDPYLEVTGNVKAAGWLFANNATLTGPAANPFMLEVNQDLKVDRNLFGGAFFEQVAIVKPANPPAGSLRSYPKADSHYYSLNSAGVENAFIDGTTTLGGYLRGTALNAIISVPNNNWIFAKNAAGAEVTWILPGVDNITYVQSLSATTGIQFRSGSGAALATLDSSGNLQAGGVVAAAANYFRFGATNSSVAWYWDATYIHSTHQIMNNGNTYFFAANPGIFLTWSAGIGEIQSSHPLVAPFFDAANAGYVVRVAQSINSAIYFDPATTGLFQVNLAGTNPTFRFNATTSSRYFDLTPNSPTIGMTTFGGTEAKLVAPQFIMGGSSFAFLNMGRSVSEVGATVHFYCGGDIYAGGNVSGATITNRSSRKLKEGIVALADEHAMDRVRNPLANPVTFRWSWEEHQKRQAVEPLPPGSHRSGEQHVGFVAEDMQYVVPEAVTFDSTTGEASGIMYGNLTAVLWGAVRNLDQRVRELEGA